MHFAQLLRWHGGRRVRDTPVEAYVGSRGSRDALSACRVPGSERSLRLLRLPRGWLYRPLCLPITADRRTLLDLHRIYSPEKYEPVYTEAFAKRLGSADAAALEDVLVLASGGRNYWHFIMDYLPRLFFAAAIPEVRDYALTVDATLTQKERTIVETVATRAGIAKPRMLTVESEIVPLRNALCPEHVDRFAAAAIWDGVLYPTHVRADRGIDRLFVTRTASHRRLVNQDELAAKLQSLGFVCVDPGDLAFDEQVALFAGARVVVGVHGAALANLVFARRGTLFVELYTTVQQAFYAELASAKGLRHEALAGEPAGEARDHHDDFRIDAAALLERLKNLAVS